MDYLYAVVLFAISSSITPGPNNIMVMTSGLNFGARRSLPLLAGICVGFAIMLLLVGLGGGHRRHCRIHHCGSELLQPESDHSPDLLHRLLPQCRCLDAVWFPVKALAAAWQGPPVVQLHDGTPAGHLCAPRGHRVADTTRMMPACDNKPKNRPRSGACFIGWISSPDGD